MKKSLLVGAIVVVILAIASVIALRQPKPNTQSQTSSNTDQSPSTANTPSNGQTATITYSDNGFSPASITVTAGTTVTVKNTSSHTVQFDSDPHPAHTDDTDLNAGIIESGSSQSFVVSQKGTFGYHNHLDASETGTIIIQ